MYNLMGLDTPDRMSAICDKDDDICDIFFAFLHTNPLLKRDLLSQGRFFSLLV